MAEHTPVLVAELMAQFEPQSGDTLLDCTLGHGGHAKAFLAAAENLSVVGIDADVQALAVGKKELAWYGDRVQYLEGSFANLQDLVLAHLAGSGTGGEVVQQHFSHVLFDLGIGSHQLRDKKRGFSFNMGGPLTMRYASTSSAQAASKLPPAQVASLNMLEKRLGVYPDVPDILRQLTAQQLSELLLMYGDERQAVKIAHALKQAARTVVTSSDLAAAIEHAVPRYGKTHPATKTFQALRMAVNRELESLQAALPQAAAVLKPGGTLGVISFHSLEDRLVKQFLKKSDQLTVLNKKPKVVTREEMQQNPRSRSAKLRFARKKE